MRRATAVLLLAGVAAVVIGAAAFLLWPSQAPAGDSAAGKLIYDRLCASCHGANLEGQPNWQKRLPNGRLPAPPHDATGHTWHHADAELFTMVKQSLSALVPGYESDMPAFGGILTDQQIWDVLAYIKTRWPPEIAARQKQINTAAERAK